MIKRGSAGFALAALLAAACGSGDDAIDLGPDAEGGGVDCDPIEQTGCESGEKCAQRVESEEPLISRPDCVPEGDASVGEACGFVGEPEDGDGYDNCEAGLSCASGECTPICDVRVPSICEESDGVCVQVGNFFGDAVGLCAKTCDVVEQDCEFEHAGDGDSGDNGDDGADGDNGDNGENGDGGDGGDDGDNGDNGDNGDDGDNGRAGACYLHVDYEEGVCLNVADDAGDRGQGSECVMAASGVPFINGCQGGHGCWLPVGQGVWACTFFCEPTGEFDGQPCAEDGGPGADGYECRYLSGWLESLIGEPSSVAEDQGICIPTDLEGLDSCRDNSDGAGCEPEFLDEASAPDTAPARREGPPPAPKSLASPN